MDEAYLKKRLVKALEAKMPGAVVLRHEDLFTAGIPDISVTWEGTTTWIEVKFDRPRARGRLTALQVRMLRRLTHHGSAIHLIYEERRDGKSTLVYRANMLNLSVPGFDHESVAWYIKGLHEALQLGYTLEHREV